MESPSIFLSHAHEDNRFARKLAGALSQRGALVWVDECELRLGDSVIDCVAKAIAEGDFLLAIISPADRYWADGDKAGVGALAAFDLESETAQERWVFHLKAATRGGRASVRVDGSTHQPAADRLARMGALETLRSSGSWVFYEISERGRGLLTAIHARERAPSVEAGS